MKNLFWIIIAIFVVIGICCGWLISISILPSINHRFTNADNIISYVISITVMGAMGAMIATMISHHEIDGKIRVKNTRKYSPPMWLVLLCPVISLIIGVITKSVFTSILATLAIVFNSYLTYLIYKNNKNETGN